MVFRAVESVASPHNRRSPRHIAAGETSSVPRAVLGNEISMQKTFSDWPLGVFASIDAGLGVNLEVARELGVSTVHLHTPSAASRTPERAREFARRLADLETQVTCVFGGFEGESYADIPTVRETVGLVPPATRADRLRELLEIADFSRLLDVNYRRSTCWIHPPSAGRPSI